jgi:hypothetical protein
MVTSTFQCQRIILFLTFHVQAGANKPRGKFSKNCVILIQPRSLSALEIVLRDYGNKSNKSSRRIKRNP